VHAGVVLAIEACHGVARLMVGGQLLFLGSHNTALLLGACHDLHGSFLDILHGDGLAAAAGSQQSGLIDQVLQVSTRKTCGALCDDPEGDIGSQRLILGVDLEDLLAALDIGQAHIDLTVKAARTEQGLIQNVGTVGGCHHDDAIVGLKAVHLDQQLVQGLLPLVVAAAQTCAALTAHGIDLIDEDDAGHGLFGLIKQVTHTGCADTDIHFHEVGAGNGVEGHPCLTGAGTSQQGLTGTRRAHQQNAVGDAGTQRVELVGALEELHDLLQLFLFLVLTGNVGKGRGLFVLVLVLHLGLAHVHNTAAASAAAHHGEEQEAGAAQHSQVEQDLHPGDGLLQGGVIVLHGRGRVGCVVGIDILLDVLDKHIGVGQLIAHRHRAVIVSGRPHGRGRGGEHIAQQTAGGLCGSGGTCGFGQLLLALLQRQGDDAGVAVQRKGCDLIVLKVVHHSRVAHGGAAGTAVAGAQHRPDHQDTGQCQRQDQGIKARSFRLQKGSTPVLIRFCYA
jgi:hypothetical protein